MHMQPIYRTNPFVTVEGNGRGRTNAYISGTFEDVGADIFRRGLCLPSDNKMTPEQQNRIIDNTSVLPLRTAAPFFYTSFNALFLGLFCAVRVTDALLEEVGRTLGVLPTSGV